MRKEKAKSVVSSDKSSPETPPKPSQIQKPTASKPSKKSSEDKVQNANLPGKKSGEKSSPAEIQAKELPKEIPRANLPEVEVEADPDELEEEDDFDDDFEGISDGDDDDDDSDGLLIPLENGWVCEKRLLEANCSSYSTHFWSPDGQRHSSLSAIKTYGNKKKLKLNMAIFERALKSNPK